MQSELSSMAAAGDPSQTTPVQIMHVLFMLCCCTQIEGESKLHTSICKTTQHKNIHSMYWCSLASMTRYHRAWLSVFHANVSICKLTETFKKYKFTHRER